LVAVIVVTTLWLLACFLPVWETRSDTGEWNVVVGGIPALIGFVGLLAACPAWFANLLLIWLCIRLLKGRRTGFWLSVVAFAVAASAYMLPAIYGDNETDTIVSRRIGFYLWLGSFLVMALAYVLPGDATKRREWILVRWITLALLALGVAGLERLFPVGVSPLETALRDPNDLTALSNALAHNPSQAEKDAALYWAVLRDISGGQSNPSPQIERLIAAGANVNQVDSYGETLLMRAVQHRGSESMVSLLVGAGADVNARGGEGKTVLDIAQEYNSNPQCQQILVKAGAHSGATTSP
jgi:hypothetical protein